MSGRKQHHIPQSVLRAFKTPSSGKTKKVWVFSKNKKFKSPTADVAAERHFYSERTDGNAQTLDDLITQYENLFSEQLSSLRDIPIGTVADPLIAAEVVAHLTIRNAHLRTSFVSGMRLLADGATDLFCNESNLRAMFGTDEKQFPPSIATNLDELLAHDPRFASIGLPRDVVHKVAFMSMKENFRSFVANSLPYIRLALERFAFDAPEHMRTGHNRALSTGLAPDGRTAALGSLHWTIQVAPAGGVILPDCVVLGIEANKAPQPLIMCDLQKVTNVLMPLAPDRLLIGSCATNLCTDLTRFNADAVACSHDFFVSNRDCVELDALVPTMGERSRETIEEAIAFAFDGFKKERQLPVSASAQILGSSIIEAATTANQRVEAAARQALNYQMTFTGIVDKETAEKIAAVLEGIVRELGPVMDLDRLDGFTFAQDYEAALRELDRGFKTGAPLSATKEEYGVGVAMTPIIVRDGVVKSRVVGRMWIASGLISENEDTQQLALHTIVHQLSHVACNQVLDESLPGFFLSKIEDEYEGFLYPCIASAWTGYFAARASAVFNPPSGTAYRELALSALKRAEEGIPAARLSYRYDGDLSRLLGVVVPCLTALLNHLGLLLGHYDGIRQSPFEDQQFESALELGGLRAWIDLFQSDLALVWDRRGQWNSVDEILALNRHAERLFWQYGLFPWKTPEGRVRIEVPLSTDARHLYGLKPALLRLRHRISGWFIGKFRQAQPG